MGVLVADRGHRAPAQEQSLHRWPKLHGLALKHAHERGLGGLLQFAHPSAVARHADDVSGDHLEPSAWTVRGLSVVGMMASTGVRSRSHQSLRPVFAPRYSRIHCASTSSSESATRPQPQMQGPGAISVRSPSRSATRSRYPRPPTGGSHRCHRSPGPLAPGPMSTSHTRPLVAAFRGRRYRANACCPFAAHSGQDERFAIVSHRH